MSWRIASSEGVTTLYDERGEAIGRLHEDHVIVHPDHDSNQVTAALLEHQVQDVENQRRPSQDKHQRHEPVSQPHEARREPLGRVGDSVHQVAGQAKDQEGGENQHTGQISSKKAAELDPKCPKCGAPMYWRDAAGLTGLHPEGAWECSNQHCWNMLTPGELAPDTLLPPEDTTGSDLTLPEHWGAADEPSPINQSMLTLNEVGHDMPMTGGGLGTPFVYDRGTQTVHMGPPESYHADIQRLLQGKLRGPIFHGEHDGGVLSWHTTPNTDERQAVTDLLSRNYGHPFHDPLERGMDEFKLGFFKRALKAIKRLGKTPLRCSACGDVLMDGPDCPRCNWGGWNTSDDAATKNPKDPTVDMHRGIQSKTKPPTERSNSRGPLEGGRRLPTQRASRPLVGLGRQPTARQSSSYDDLPYWQRNDEWTPGVEGKGWLGENGVYAWRIGQDRYPRHMDNRFRAEQAVGKLLRPFQISPTGHVYDIGRGAISPEHMDAITYNDPRLHNVASSPEVWGDPETGGEFQLSHHSAASGGWEITADYQGYTNWDTWNTKLMMDNDYDLYQFVQKMMESGRWKSPNDVRDWALKHVLGPHNQQAIEDAKEWNSIPEEERLDPHWEDLNNRNPDAAELVNNLGFGPDTSDSEPTLMDPELVNWDEIWQHLVDERDEGHHYDDEHNRFQDMGLTFAMPGHMDETNQMLDAWLKHHGVVEKDQRLPDGASAEHHTRMQVPIEHLPMDDGEYSPETYAEWQQQGYGEPRVRSFGWSTLHDIQRGRANSWQTQRMQQALTNTGYTPEQQQQIMRQKWEWRPDESDSQGRRGVWADLDKERQPPAGAPSNLDQPGDFYFPSDWEAPGSLGTFSRIIPQDRWWTAARCPPRRS